VAFHGLSGKLVGVYAPGGDFDFVVAGGGFWGDDPVVRRRRPRALDRKASAECFTSVS
jgi:hypothetical protein